MKRPPSLLHSELYTSENKKIKENPFANILSGNWLKTSNIFPWLKRDRHNRTAKRGSDYIRYPRTIPGADERNRTADLLITTRTWKGSREWNAGASSRNTDTDGPRISETCRASLSPQPYPPVPLKYRLSADFDTGADRTAARYAPASSRCTRWPPK